MKSDKAIAVAALLIPVAGSLFAIIRFFPEAVK